MVRVNLNISVLNCSFLSGLQLVDFISTAPRLSTGHAGGAGLEYLCILAVEAAVCTQEACLPPGPDLLLSCGVPLAHEQGAEGVCTALGGLVQSGVLPALKEVRAFSLCSYTHMLCHCAVHGSGAQGMCSLLWLISLCRNHAPTVCHQAANSH